MSGNFYFIMRGFSSTNGTFVNFILDHLPTVAVAVISGAALLLTSLTPRGRLATTMQVTQMINRGKTTAVIDVRTADEFAAGHLRDAKNIPLADLNARVGELDKSKIKTVIVIDQNGSRVAKAERLLKTAGFADIYSLEGGIAAWTAAGLPVTK